MNKTLYLLWFSDIFLLTGFGLATPIMAIFIKETIIGGTILAAGIASAIFLITKAIVQIPFSKYVDSHEDRTKWLWIGTFLIVTVPVQYLFARDVTSIYIAQIVYGVGAGLAASAWLSLWSRNLDKNHEGFEWSIYSATVGIGTGAAALTGGLIATYFGFNITLAVMSILALVGFIILLYIENNTSNNINAKTEEIHYHKKNKLTHNSHHK